MKTCTGCGKTKPLPEYHTDNRNRDGRRSRCKTCYTDSKRTRRAANPAKYRLAIHKNGAKRRSLSTSLTVEDFEKLVDYSCHYCGTVENLGYDRVDPDQGYERDNIVPCCWLCNRAKSNMPLDEFVTWVNRVHKHLNRQ